MFPVFRLLAEYGSGIRLAESVLVVLVVVWVVLVVAFRVVAVASHYYNPQSHHQDHQNHHQDHQNHTRTTQKDSANRIPEPYSASSLLIRVSFWFP